MTRKRFARRLTRRGVASVLAMMLLVIFGSLVTAMAVASKGNIRSASTHEQVMRAMGAAETGLAFAQKRLGESTNRFVVAHSDIDSDFGWGLWRGSLSGYGTVSVQDPVGFSEASSPGGLAEALANAHAADVNFVEINNLDAPTISDAPLGTDASVFKETHWLYTPAIALEQVPDGGFVPTFQITYAPLANGTDVRVIVTGSVTDFGTGRPISRTLMQDFRVVKRVNAAVIAPTRIMIGKNVSIVGDLGARYEDLEVENGDPLVIRSDFLGLDPVLDAKLEDLYDSIAANDTDGDNRLRFGHPVEGVGLPSNDEDYDGSGSGDGAFVDATGDGYLDEYDVFINHYDGNDDGRVEIATEFIDGGGGIVDADLAILLDSAEPDRNRNGVYGFDDADGDGVMDVGTEDPYDYDDATSTYADKELGYMDGYLDRMDQYAKVHGALRFKVSSQDWESEQGDWQERVLGAISPEENQNPVLFEASEAELPEVTASSFDSTELALTVAADGGTFSVQVASQLGVSEGDLLSYVEATPEGATDGDGNAVPRYLRVDPDDDGDGLPDNHEQSYVHFEAMPYRSPAVIDWYYRPVYENFVFKDVQIPQGTNALFVNCTFVGVTFVRSHTGNSHPHWTLYGKLEFDSGAGHPVPAHERTVYGDDGSETPDDLYSGMAGQLNPSDQLVLLAVDPLDKGDILESEIGSFDAGAYAQLPEPLLIDGQRVTDTKNYSNNIRFHDCLFVGSIVSDSPGTYTHVRNKLQFTGKTRFVQEHPDEPENQDLNPEEDDRKEIEKSSMMLPNYSVDVGSFNSPQEQNVQLQGAVVAGVLDVRGNAKIDGTLLLTFKPVLGSGPMQDHLGNPIGNPAGFNTTIGYFGPEDGDEEALDPETLPEIDGVRIVGYDTNGDGLADVGPGETPPDGAVAVPFNGYGRVELRFDPDMTLPDGIVLPLQLDPLPGTYQEGGL